MAFNQKLLKSGFFIFMQRSLILIFGFGSFVFLIRIFDKDSFGTWSLYIAIAALLETIRYGFVKSAQIRFYAIAEDQKGKKEIMAASLALNFIISVIVVLLLLFLSFFIDDITNSVGLSSLLLFYIIIYLALVPHTYLEYYYESTFSFKMNFWAYAIRQSLFFIILAAFVLSGYPLQLLHVAGIQLFSVIASLSYLIVTLEKKVIKLETLRWRDVRRMMNYGKYVFGTSISSLLSRNVDQFMISFFLGPSGVALYNPALRISSFVEVPTNSLATLVFPISSKKSSQRPAYLKYLYEKSVGYNLAILIPCAIIIILLAEPIVLLIAGKGYEGAIPVLRLYILTVLFLPLGRQFGVIFDSIGRQKTTFYLLFFTTFLNIGLNFYFIQLWGIMGAVCATLLTFLVRFIINQLLLNKVLQVALKNVLGFMLELYQEVFKKLLHFRNIHKIKQ